MEQSSNIRQNWLKIRRFNFNSYIFVKPSRDTDQGGGEYMETLIRRYRFNISFDWRIQADENGVGMIL